MKVTRRNAMLYGALTPAGGFAVPGLGGEMDTTLQGINVKLFWGRSGCDCSICSNLKAGWQVVVPDWENISGYWVPGIPLPWKNVSLPHFLEQLEKEFNLVPKA